jgi:glutathione synthase/RimK-type ligase-like ATP-grasp enzyme
LNIAILSRNPRLYSTRRLVEGARARGHRVRVLDHTHCFMDITSARPTIHLRDESSDRTRSMQSFRASAHRSRSTALRSCDSSK